MEVEVQLKKVQYFDNDVDFETLKLLREKEMKEYDELNYEQKEYEYSWEKFYNQNKDNFFKNRNYLSLCFEEIKQITKENSK